MCTAMKLLLIFSYNAHQKSKKVFLKMFISSNYVLYISCGSLQRNIGPANHLISTFDFLCTLTKGVCWNLSALTNMTQIWLWFFWWQPGHYRSSVPAEAQVLVTSQTGSTALNTWQYLRLMIHLSCTCPLSFLLHLRKHTDPHLF